jgi:hypothetical protein
MPTLLDHLRLRNDSQSGLFAQNHALIEKDYGVAHYVDAAGGMVDKVDESKQISWWCISTSAMDREGDILVPKGCMGTIKSYTANPCVVYDHKKSYILPVGKSIGRSGGPVDVYDDKICAGCQHHSETLFADEVWRLVMKGILKGASVSFVPLSGERIKQKAHEDGKSFHPRYRITNWNLTEWSICPVGINPEAVRIELSSGSIKSEELLKSLTPLAQEPKIMAQGFNPTEDVMVEFDTINKEEIQAIRFHKSHFADQEACVSWLKEKSLDDSLFSENTKSFDFVQTLDEASEKTAKVLDGVYVIYSEKAFPPNNSDQKKKKKPGEQEPPRDDPDAGASNPTKKKVPSTENEADKGQQKPGEKPNGEQGDEQQLDENGQPIEPKAGDGQEVPQEGQAPAQQVQVGTMTYSARSFVDVLKHKMAELTYFQHVMGMHDHDGLSALIQEEMKMVQDRYNKWLQAAKGAFPDLDFAKLTSAQEEDNDDLEDAETVQNRDANKKQLEQGQMKSMSDEELEEVLVGLELIKVLG